MSQPQTPNTSPYETQNQVDDTLTHKNDLRARNRQLQEELEKQCHNFAYHEANRAATEQRLYKSDQSILLQTKRLQQLHVDVDGHNLSPQKRVLDVGELLRKTHRLELDNGDLKSMLSFATSHTAIANSRCADLEVKISSYHAVMEAKDERIKDLETRLSHIQAIIGLETQKRRMRG